MQYRSRWIWIACAYATLVVLAHWLLTHGQQPRVFWDSSAYLEEAQQPFRLAQLFYPKPIFVSLVLRVVGTEPGRITGFQAWLSVLSWLCFTAALVTSLSTTRARIAALVVGAILALDPFRLGYTAALLSESINDSELALLTACLVMLTSSPRRTRWLVITSIVATCWMLTRDTNAVTALVALGVALLVSRPSPGRYRRELIAAGVVAGVAVFALWSTTVRPGDTHLTFQHDWPEDFRARMTYSMMNNVIDRVIPDPAASAFFVDHGLPQRDALAAIPPEHRQPVIVDPALAPARQWIASHARHVWLLWLASTPWARIHDQRKHGWQLLGVADEHASYMPRHWTGDGALSPLRRLASNHALVGLLLLVLPLLVVRARRHRWMLVIVATIAGGWLGSVAALYGDSSEVGRHCYGSGQQVVLGLVLALLACIECGLRRSDQPI